ncbi:nicotinate-nucleotide--dimethylbenzimidazole phosphoribosyltransferase [Abyssisolibacter fermentans]|nr:nicotinate-nucleotide--dimethylbenzimidazole phosphoribosyltransferase [Abyssisolibacter fermentans]
MIKIEISGFFIIACILEPNVKGYLIPSHKSNEKGAKLASELLDFKPML